MVENVIQIKSGKTINNGASVKIKKKNNISAKNIIFGLLLHVIAKNDKYLASTIDDSVIMCNEIRNTTKTIPTNFNEKS